MKINNKFFQAIISIFSFIGRWMLKISSWYKQKWVKYTYNKYGEFIYKRGLAMIAATLASFFVLFITINLLLQTAYYFTTYKKEIIYLNHSEEIYPDDNIWGVRGCHTKQCDSDSSLYFRIKPSTFHHIWSILHSGRIFLPDAIGSSVPTGLTQCEVTSYGVRMRLTMLFNIYPNILKIKCDETIHEASSKIE